MKLTNSVAHTNYFHKVISRAWSVTGLKGYFIQKDFLDLGAPKAELKLIKIRQTSCFTKPNVKMSKVFVLDDSR